MKNFLKPIVLITIVIAIGMADVTGALNDNPGSGSAPENETFLISGSIDVADVALRGGDFGSWNYGRGIFLEAGYFIGLYDTHPGASLIRFNLSGLGAEKVSAAKLRIYKPRSMSQQGAVEVSVYKVSEKNGDWLEGGSASQEEEAAVKWRGKSDDKPWAGAEGCSKEGVDYELPVLDKTQMVNPETSGWLEFNLPADLVQSWIDNPESNAGLYIRGQEDTEVADEAHFFSSEHPSGKGPQLLVEASKGAAKTEKQEWVWNPSQYMPPVNSLEYARWKEFDKGRYPTWATGPEMHLSDDQGLWPYYWDTQIRINTLAECFIPLSKSLVKLKKFIAEGDEDALYRELDIIRLHLLKYEDVKAMRIHQSGPVADELTSIQLGTMLGKEGFGVHARKGVAKYAHKSDEEIGKLIKKELNKLYEEWEISESQSDTLEKYIRLYEGNRWYHGNLTGKYMREVQAMLEIGEESEELYVAARKLFYNHKLFVYWLSDFNTPKWNLWLNIVKVAPQHVAQEFLNARDDNYQMERYAKELESIRTHYWYPPVLYVNSVDADVPANGFGTRAWPFKDVDDALRVAYSGTEIRIVGKVDEKSLNLRGKKLIIAPGYNSTFNHAVPDEEALEAKKKAAKEKKKKKSSMTEEERAAEKEKKRMASDMSPKGNLNLFNQFEERPREIQELYAAAYTALASNQLGATYNDLAKDEEFMSLAARNGTTHLGGPMLGCITPGGANVWVRTLKPAQVEVRLVHEGIEKTFGPVSSTPKTDLSAIVEVNGLKPGTSYPYQVLINGKAVSIPEHAAIQTLRGEMPEEKTRITFGSCFHKWGLGNKNQSDMILSREPDAMLLLGDIGVQDRLNLVGLHRADYLLRDFFPPWQNLVARVPVYAQWDDHDYFDNDLAGIPEGFTRKDKENVWGVFRYAWNNTSYGFGDKGKGIFQRTRIGPCDVIMIDHRYFRDYEKGDYLGDKQMKWLEEQLLDCKGPFIIISGGTMWSDYVSRGKDSWGMHDPEGREKIFSLIEKHKIGGVLLISGDRHGTRGFRIPRESGFNFYEFEAGSLGGRTGPAPTNPEWDTQFYGFSGVYAFGEFTIDASLEDPEVTFRLIKDDGTILHKLTLKRSELTPK